MAISPINSVPKKDSLDRIVVDLSFPEGAAINEGTEADSYQDIKSKLSFPKVDDFGKIIHKKGSDCLMFKRDLSSAYRQLPVDCGDIRLLGYWYKEQYFFNLALPMGLRSSAHCCQMVTSAIVHVFSNKGFGAENYMMTWVEQN